MAPDRMRELLATAQENLRSSGSLMPVLFVEGARESVIVGIEEFERTAELRQAQLHVVGVWLSKMRPRRITAVVDAYWKKSDVELPLTRSLADYPDAGEAVVVVSLDSRGRSRLLVCPYERHPSLEGLEIEFKPVLRLPGRAETYLLEAFFEGVAAARRRSRDP